MKISKMKADELRDFDELKSFHTKSVQDFPKMASTPYDNIPKKDFVITFRPV